MRKTFRIYCRRVGLVGVSMALGISAFAQINNASDLVAAVNSGANGDEVVIAPGVFELTAPLKPKPGMVIRGAGAGNTIIRPADSWDPGVADLPDNATKAESINRKAYLIDLGYQRNQITISDLTLNGGGRLHGAITGDNSDYLQLFNLDIEDVLWSGLRIFRMNFAKIHDNQFHDAGGRHGGQTGGAMFLTYTTDTEFWNNRITRSQGGRKMFGIKARQLRNCRIHHNTILVDFSIEAPFENDYNVEIDHNVCKGVISVPKYKGGGLGAGTFTFHIHHNWSTKSYAIEWDRNHIEVDHNLFDFNTDKDIGNLISGFSDKAAQGPALFHNNLISNPGRGIFWKKGVYNNIQFYNNHIRTNTTVTPRTEGLFSFNDNTDFSTVTIKDNIVECFGLARPLLRRASSYAANIENNTLVNVRDSDRYDNPSTGAKRGLLQPLRFTCGVNGEYSVDGWNVTKTADFPSAGQWYVIKNRSAGLNIRNEDCNTGHGTFVELFDGTGKCAQWRFVRHGNSWRIQNRRSGLFLETRDCASTNNQAEVSLRDSSASCNTWSVTPVDGNGYYYLANVQANLRLANKECAAVSNQTRMVLNNKTNNCSQWQLIPVGQANGRMAADFTPTQTISETANHVFPNPTTGRLSFVAESPVNYIKVYGLSGHLRYHRALYGQMTADLNALANGLYWVELGTENGPVRHKIIIRR